jgi:hypothetical protein
LPTNCAGAPKMGEEGVPSGRKSFASRAPRAMPQRGAALALSGTLRRPLLFCAGIVATGFVIKIVGMNLVMDFITQSMQKQDERDRAVMQLAAAKWRRELAEEEHV